MESEIDKILVVETICANGEADCRHCTKIINGWKTALQAELTKARIAELESLEHEPQMHGDWQQVIEDRLKQLEEQLEP